jgi:hypothetical protein
LEGEERAPTHHHRTENLIADVEVVVGVAAALTGEDAVMRVLGGIFRHADAEARPQPAIIQARQTRPDAMPSASIGRATTTAK